MFVFAVKFSEKNIFSLLFRLLFSFILLTVHSSCSSTALNRNISTAFKIADKNTFENYIYETAKFNIFSFRRLAKTSGTINVYIEGDGRSWIDRRTISPNPTPPNPTALKLAVLDNSSNVLYLARPCQYVDLKFERNCSKQTWTSHRYSSDVIEAYNEILNHLKKNNKDFTFNLIGHSGGGTVAVLVAANRDDIKSIRTLAANLDHVALNRERNVSQLEGSLNPINFAKKINFLPQVHYQGKNDKVIPQWVAKKFVKFSNSSCVSSMSLIEVTHENGWEDFWQNNYKIIPKCD